MYLVFHPVAGALLGQADGSGGGVAGAIFWSVVVIALCVGGFFVYSLLKRWMGSDEEPASSDGGFSFSDLRRLHREGKLTDEEFEKARTKMAASAKRVTESLPDPLAGRGLAGGGAAAVPPAAAAPPMATPRSSPPSPPPPPAAPRR